MSTRWVLPAVAILVLTALATTTARSGSPSMLPGMPHEVLSWRQEILSPDDYARLVREWETYIEEHPRSAVARVQLARAERYAKSAPVDERNALIWKAHELDPACPEALVGLAAMAFGERPETGEIPTYEEAREYALKAVSVAPDWPDPHFDLWVLCQLLDRQDEASDHLRALIRKGGYDAPVLDFGYNLLVSADSQAIVITNGDNDTYPPLGLQATRGVRPDVTIANASLLNRPEYAASVWKRAYGDTGPFGAGEIEALHETCKAGAYPGEPFSRVVIRELVEKVRTGAWKRPVYFAVTISPYYLEGCPQELELVGMLWRVTRDPKPADDETAAGDAEPEVRIDAMRTLRLVRDEFRMESATDLSYAWTDTSPVRMLMRNYPAILNHAAGRSARDGDMESVRYALGEAIRILDFLGFRDEVKQHARYWKEMDPNNPEPDRWLN